MKTKPIKAPLEQARRFANVIAGKDSGDEADKVVKDLLTAAGFLPLDDFLQRNMGRLRPGRSIPVLVMPEGGTLVWIGADKDTCKIGVGWADLNAPLLIDYYGHDLGWIARPPTPLFKIPLQNQAH